MRGNITRRGKTSWRLKFDLGRGPDGRRRFHTQTVKGKRAAAESELTRLLKSVDDGAFVEPSKLTVGDYLDQWLAAVDVSPKTLQRYKQLVVHQIKPRLPGTILLQKLKPADVARWHGVLAASGGSKGGRLSPISIGHAHRVLTMALGRAMKLELVARNVASTVRPPKGEAEEIEILTSAQMADVLAKLAGHAIFAFVAVALGTGARRGELLALRWQDVDLDGAAVRIERSVEQTTAGLRFKLPKTKAGRRAISLPIAAVDALRTHRRQQLEQRLALGLGRPDAEALVFCDHEGEALSPDGISQAWRRAVVALGLPNVRLHALRHSHASALIAGGLDVVSVSRRLGHASPTITLGVYSHMFRNTDGAAAQAIEAALRGTTGQR